MAKRKRRSRQSHPFHSIAGLLQIAGFLAIVFWMASDTSSAIVHSTVLIAGLASIGRVMYIYLEERRTISLLESFAGIAGIVLVVGAIQHLF